jgi:methylmalonyl-CoA/ethylmalonyl-CoA epimerase
MGLLARASARERYPGPVSEYGPSGPYERPVRGYGEDCRGNLDNASIEAAPLHAAAAGTVAGNLNDPDFKEDTVGPEGETMVLPQLTRIDHVGIACRNLEKAIGLYQATFGLEVVSLEVNEEQGVREAMMQVGKGPAGVGELGVGYVQLLEPLAPDTPVGKFMARRGEGLHHIGYGVSDVRQALAAIGGTGIRLIDERPRHGSMGASIAFLHPGDLGGVLTELVQAAGPE